MTVNEAIHTRRSIRKFQDKALSRDMVLDLLEAARQAPSGNNAQPWKFIVIEDETLRRKIAEISHNQTWMASAPVYIAACADLGTYDLASIKFDEETQEFNAKRAIRDTSNSIENLMLRAVELGLGTCWIGWFEQKDIKPLLGVPDSAFVLGVLPVGYPAESPAARPRRPLEDSVFGGSWGKAY